MRGVEMAIGQMKVEESAKVTVSSKYGFGEAGSPEHDIPGEATLVYFIRLNSFQKVERERKREGKGRRLCVVGEVFMKFMGFLSNCLPLQEHFCKSPKKFDEML